MTILFLYRFFAIEKYTNKRNSMKRHYLGIIALGALGLQNVYAEDIKANENDTIKTYNMGEVIVTSSTKETNNLRTLPGSVSILSPQ